MRLVIVVLVLMLCAIARAQDDEGLLDTPPLEGIPERMEAVEHEWHEEVGTKDPVDDDKATATDDEKEEKEGGLAGPDTDADDEEAPARHDDVPNPAKAAALSRPSKVFPPPIEKPKEETPETGAKTPAPAPPTAPED